MCDVCKIEKVNSPFLNGPSNKRHTRVKFYKVFKDEVAVALLCHLHTIEVFILGEPRFFKSHKRFALHLAKVSKAAEEDNDDGFGFAS